MNLNSLLDTDIKNTSSSLLPAFYSMVSFDEQMLFILMKSNLSKFDLIYKK